jgi:hypothetical protein
MRWDYGCGGWVEDNDIALFAEITSARRRSRTRRASSATPAPGAYQFFGSLPCLQADFNR